LDFHKEQLLMGLIDTHKENPPHPVEPRTKGKSSVFRRSV
jgi:hypothetical protein